MAQFTRLIRFESDNGKSYIADLGKEILEPPSAGSSITAFKSFDDLVSKAGPETVTLQKLLAPLPRDDLPIYCVGLNYKTHALEASLQVTKTPPLWTKPAATLANPGQDILMNDHCATSFPDYEGELVFVTSRTCKDLTESEAADAILGYTIGNDLSCRLFQLPTQGGGQFFYAKAFDNFAPIGPTLVSKDEFSMSKKLTLRVNGEIRQEADFEKDMVFSPAKVLSFMSQGTTIPAYTAVMSGTPAGVGAFMKPKQFLKNGDVVEVVLPGVGELRNKIVFQ
ncbi:Uu.00g076220.m01.CDS01 [Anthostomella pinea]|uniref:Uu.00g076220.m01.CDS01 n=1 Tax=Anthostomella pinea TaxID=933095 RepID=A0AAI8VVT9_9PEZI|nr:Uu.00g076220.m01.CDS01 [Anthostomella pinea]